MADISQMSDADLLAAYQAGQQQPSPIQSISDEDLTKAYRASTPVTATDRAHAAEGGILGGLAYTATGIPDAVANVYQLGKAAVGTGYGLTHTDTTQSPDRTPGGLYHFIAPDGTETFSKNAPPDGSKPVTSTITHIPDSLQPGIAFPVGQTLTGLMDQNPLTSTQAPRPDDTASRYLNTAGNVLGGVAGGEGVGAVIGSAPSTAAQLARSLAVSTPGALAGRYVAEKKPFESDAANNAAAVLTQALGTSAVGGLTRPKGDLLPENQIKNEAVTEGQKLGYQFPSATTNPTFGNTARENFAGKTNVAQHMSIDNQGVTNEGARADMRLPQGKGGAITDLELETAKANAAPGYDSLRNAGPINPPSNFGAQLDTALARQSGAGRLSGKLADPELPGIVADLKQKAAAGPGAFQASDAMDAISALRDKASAAYRSGNAQAGAAYKGVSKVLEDAVESDLTNRGGSAADLVNNFKDSRKQFAIINSVEDNRNAATGNVVAQKLAGALKKGDFLSGNLETAGRAAAQAPAAFAEPTKTAGNHLGMWGSLAGGLLAAKEAHELLPESLQGLGIGTAVAASSIPLARGVTRLYVQGPGQSNALPRGLVPTWNPDVLAGSYAAGAANANR